MSVSEAFKVLRLSKSLAAGGPSQLEPLFKRKKSYVVYSKIKLKRWGEEDGDSDGVWSTAPDTVSFSLKQEEETSRRRPAPCLPAP